MKTLQKIIIRLLSDEIIANRYRNIAQRNLPIKQEVIKVKKGNAKYYVMFYEAPDGIMRMNLGRHPRYIQNITV